MLQLLDRVGFDLPDPLSGDRKTLPHLFKMLYDIEAISEEAFLEWSARVTKKVTAAKAKVTGGGVYASDVFLQTHQYPISGAAEVSLLEKTTPFITWLEEAEEENDDEEDDDEDDEDDE